MKIKRILTLSISCLLYLNFSSCSVKSAEYIVLQKGLFSRTISVKNLKDLAKTRKAKGPLKNILKLTNQKEEEVSKLLTQEYEIPLVVTSKLLYSKIGNVIIERVAQIIYPKNTPQFNVSVPAIRSGVIKAIAEGEGKINLISFFAAYPNKVISIDINSLSKAINKVESMSDLVDFFMNSPLEKLKDGSLSA